MADLGDVAAKLGLHVFACDASKRPCVQGGFKAAKTDSKAISEMFRISGAKMIGVPTGKINGIVVIDVDVKAGALGMDWLNENAEALPQTRTHKTQSGGLHLIFKCPDVEIRNSASRVAPGVDVRAEGGYVIYPPSPGYQVADPTEPADMPRWLIRACLPAERPSEAPWPTHDPITHGGTKYGLAALRDECAAISSAYYGRQETTLNEAALKIGSLVAGGELDESPARNALVQAGNAMSNAAGERPWTPREIEEKVRRGMRDGSASPRSAPNEHQEPGRKTAENQNVPLNGTIGTEKNKNAPASSKVLKYLTFSEIEASLYAADFVEGLLIERAMSVIYGESNVGKTFFVTDLAFHVAAGIEWAGRQVEQGAVLYLALEGAHGIRNRIAALKETYGMDDAIIPFAVVTIGLNLLYPEADAEAVVQTAASIASRFETGVKLIVVDTLSRAMAGGNENAPEDMGALVKTGDMLREAVGAHVIWVHHSGKDTAKGARGHSSLRAATDTEIEITADGKARQAEVRKQRDLEGGDVWRFELAPVVLGTNRRGKEVTSCVIKIVDGAAETATIGRSVKGHNKRALEVLADAIAEAGKPGYPGVPMGLSSVPEKWWRERFYDRAMAGAEQEAKKRGFRRAADFLVEHRIVSMSAGRVWIVRSQPENGGENDA